MGVYTAMRVVAAFAAESDAADAYAYACHVSGDVLMRARVVLSAWGSLRGGADDESDMC